MSSTVNTPVTSTVFEGLNHDELTATLATGVDHGGNPIVPYVDQEGGWPLRCCLEDSRPGDEIALIAWSPFTWHGPYRETGPIFVHASGCSGPWCSPTLPDDMDARPMTLRPYDHDHRIAYEHVTHLPAGSGLSAAVGALLSREDVAEVHGRNATGGCFAFSAHRA